MWLLGISYITFEIVILRYTQNLKITSGLKMDFEGEPDGQYWSGFV